MGDVDRVLSALDERQRAAATAPWGPVRVIAGAGTGKTRTLTHRIAYGHLTGEAPATSVLAVTHSKKAAGEIRERLGSLGVRSNAGKTFHSAALRQLGHFWSATGLPGPGPLVLDDAGPNGVYQLVRAAIGSVTGKRARDLDTDLVRDARAAVAWAKARSFTPETYASKGRAVGELSATLMAEVYAAYEAMKRQAARLDLDDLLGECASLLEREADVAERVRSAYRHIVVDEYQDTDLAQSRLLDAWLGDHRSLFVVGDPRQTIYSFKGAEPALIKGFAQKYSEALTIELVDDYRSGPQIVAVANRIMADTTASGGATGDLRGLGPSGRGPSLNRFPDEATEASEVAQQVLGVIQAGTRPQCLAVLVRYNAQIEPLVAALQARGIPTATDEPFFARNEIRAAMRALDARDPGELGTQATSAAAEAAGHNPTADVSRMGPAQLARHLALTAFAELGSELARQGLLDAASVARELAARAAAEHETDLDAVAVTTIHKAKGLEWDHVWLPRLTEGSLPSAFAISDAEQYEERRLLYVAVTRARRGLHPSWSSARSDGRANRPSTFHALLEPSPPSAGLTGLRPTEVWTQLPRGSAAGKAAPPPRQSRFKVGDRVNHQKFGLGKVVDVQGGYVVVDFSDGAGPRRIAESKLEKL